MLVYDEDDGCTIRTPKISSAMEIYDTVHAALMKRRQAKMKSQASGQATYSVFAGIYHGGWFGSLGCTTTGRVDRLIKRSGESKQQINEGDTWCCLDCARGNQSTLRNLGRK